VVAVLFVAGIFVLGSISDWNRARPWINKTVSAAIDRPFAINGDLELSWVRNVESLRWWLPRPQISASDIVIGNPDWARVQEFGGIGKITAVLDPLPLLTRTVVLPLLDVEKANIALERRDNGDNTWTFGKEKAEDKKTSAQWRFAPGLVRIHDSKLQLDDAKRKLSLQVEANSNERGVRWKAGGELNGASLLGHGSAGSLLALQDKETPYPIDFVVDVGTTHIGAVGTLSNPSQLAALDLKLELSGNSMAHLYPLTNVLLPETPAYSTSGRLSGTLNEYGGIWRYEKFKGKVGDSDLQGTVVYEGRPQRPLLSADLVSQSLDFKDLAPLIGADSNESKARRNAAVMQPPDKKLPVEPFKTDRWRSIDAHVKFDGKKIIRDEALPIHNLHLVLNLTDGVLKLDPLNFGVAGGDLVSVITLDSAQTPLRADIRISPRGLKLKELFPTVESMQASLGEINGSVALIGTGSSISSLLGSSKGEVKLFIDRGTVSKFILEAAGLNIANLVVTKLFGDHQVNLNCAASDFQVTDGVMHTHGFIVDTDAALIDVNGTIALG